MQFLLLSDLLSEFDQFLHQIADIEIVVFGCRIVRDCYIRLRFGFNSFLLLESYFSLFIVDLLFSSVVSW